MPHPHDHHPHDHPLHDHHHWDEPPAVVQKKTEEIETYLGGSKKLRRLCHFAFHAGPYHRRTSTGVIAGLAMYLARLIGRQNNYEADGPAIGVEFHVPPHLRGRSNRDSASFKLPTRLLTDVFGAEELNEVVDALVDGPPHDGAANLVLMTLLESIYDSLNDTDKQEMIDE